MKTENKLKEIDPRLYDDLSSMLPWKKYPEVFVESDKAPWKPSYINKILKTYSKSVHDTKNGAHYFMFSR